MSLIVHRAPRADQLVPGLADAAAYPLADPFAQELVLVPARGVERWLSQRLSHRLGHAEGREDGVCAGVQFRSPASLVAELVIGRPGTRENDPWAPDALVWPLLTVVDASAGEAWCAHAEHPPRPWKGRRGARAAARASLCRRPPTGSVVRVVRRAAADPARRLGAARRHRRRRPRAPSRPQLAARALAPAGRRGRRSRRPHSGTPAWSRRCAGVPGSPDLPARLSLFGHTRIARHRGRAPGRAR